MADEIFRLSQDFVPVDTGTLKKSGVVEKTLTGAIIRYRTSYAAKQEFGLPPGATEEVPAYTVKRTRMRSYSVLSSTRQFHGKTRRVSRYTVGAYTRPSYSVLPHTKTYKRGLQGRFYLTKAWDIVRPKWRKFLIDQLTGA